MEAEWTGQEPAPDMYASKVAQLDNQWNGYDQNGNWQGSGGQQQQWGGQQDYAQQGGGWNGQQSW